MITFPNAKINLGLNIVEKRQDGFHNIETVFYPLQLRDTLEFTASTVQEFSASGIEIDGKAEDNLVQRAYKILEKDFSLLPLHIHLHKKIPFGAGLGGGSADAAFMLKMLNDDFNLSLSANQLENYARELGSDCAFFVRNTPVFATGKGDEFEEIALSLSGYHLLLVKPPVHVPTKHAYSRVRPKPPKASLKEIVQLPIESWKDMMFNEFEDSVFERYSAIKKLKKQIYKAGAVYASMSGSGSSVFGIFKSEIPKLHFPENYFVWKEIL